MADSVLITTSPFYLQVSRHWKKLVFITAVISSPSLKSKVIGVSVITELTLNKPYH